MWKPAYDFLLTWAAHVGDSYRDVIQELHLGLDKMRNPITKRWKHLTGTLILVNCLDTLRSAAFCPTGYGDFAVWALSSTWRRCWSTGDGWGWIWLSRLSLASHLQVRLRLESWIVTLALIGSRWTTSSAGYKTALTVFMAPVTFVLLSFSFHSPPSLFYLTLCLYLFLYFCLSHVSFYLHFVWFSLSVPELCVRFFSFTLRTTSETSTAAVQNHTWPWTLFFLGLWLVFLFKKFPIFIRGNIHIIYQLLACQTQLAEKLTVHVTECSPDDINRVCASIFYTRRTTRMLIIDSV